MFLLLPHPRGSWKVSLIFFQQKYCLRQCLLFLFCYFINRSTRKVSDKLLQNYCSVMVWLSCQLLSWHWMSLFSMKYIFQNQSPVWVQTACGLVQTSHWSCSHFTGHTLLTRHTRYETLDTSQNPLISVTVWPPPTNRHHPFNKWWEMVKLGGNQTDSVFHATPFNLQHLLILFFTFSLFRIDNK